MIDKFNVDLVNKALAMADRSRKMPTKAPRDIRDLLGFRLSLLTTISDRKAQALFSTRYGLNLGEWRVLGALKAHGPTTLADLSRALYQDKGQLSRTIKALAGRALVSSTPQPDNRRSVIFRLTADGRRQHDRMLAFAADRNAHLLDALTARERTDIFRILDKLTLATALAYDQALASQRRRAPARSRQGEMPPRARQEVRP